MLHWLKRKLVWFLLDDGDMVVKVGLVSDTFSKPEPHFLRDLDRELEGLREDAIATYRQQAPA